MDCSTAIRDSFVRFFKDKENLALFYSDNPPSAHQYKWQVKPETLLKIGIERSEPISNAKDTIWLKQELENKWKKGNAEERMKLTKWIVRDWGEVRGNGAERLAQYADIAQNNNIPLTLQGVASYSNVLSISDCTRYAIYDARVAASLAAIQTLYLSAHPVFFHFIPGRNKTVSDQSNPNSFVSLFRTKELDKQWASPPQYKTYSLYLSLLQDILKHFPDYKIYHLEMMLFAMAETLCEDAIKKWRNE